MRKIEKVIRISDEKTRRKQQIARNNQVTRTPIQRN